MESGFTIPCSLSLQSEQLTFLRTPLPNQISITIFVPIMNTVTNSTCKLSVHPELILLFCGTCQKANLSTSLHQYGIPVARSQHINSQVLLPATVLVRVFLFNVSLSLEKKIEPACIRILKQTLHYKQGSHINVAPPMLKCCKKKKTQRQKNILHLFACFYTA